MNETMHNASSRPAVRAIVLACCAAMVAGSMPVYAAPPSAASAQNGNPGNPGDEVSLNFVNADLDSVVKAVGQATGKNFIVDPRVKGTVNLVTEKPVTRAQALESLGSILRMQGYAIVEGNGFTKVVPEADAKLQGSPVGNASARGGEQVVTQVFRLQHESANNLVPVLRPMIAPNNTITAYPANNTLVITDYADNLRRIGRIIASIDTPAAGETELIPLKNAVAIDVAATLQKLLDPSAGGAGGAGAGAALSDPSLRTSVVAEPRSNSVMVRASSAARLAQAKQLIAKLDMPAARPGNIWVVPLKNANAVQLATTLRAIVAADATLSASAATGPGGQSAAQGATSQPTGSTTGSQFNQNTQNSNYGNAGSGSGMGSGNSSFRASFGQNNTPATGGIIQADPATNALIITASEPVYRNLRAVIDDLDARRAQVYIESMIVEVTSDKASQLGIQWMVGAGGPNTYGFGGTNFGSGVGNILNLGAIAATVGSGGIGSTAAQTAIGTITGSNVAGLNGGNFGVFNKSTGLGAILSALGSDGSVNVLSTPNLITLDNEEAKILIGQNVPITTGSYAQTGSAASVTPFQTFDRKDVGITLRVKPQITDGGLVKMQIFQESSAVVNGTQNAVQGPTTNVRSIETNVLANDGQIVVLGGLLEDNYQDGEQKVPGLGDIPILGALFRSETKQRKKTNLLVFLRPIILRTAEATGALSDNRYNYMRETQQGFVSPNWLPTTSDKDTPVLPAPETVRPAPNYGDVSVVPKSAPGVQVPPGAPLPMPQSTTRSQPRLQNFAAPTSGGYDGNAPRNGG
ncbi:type II secretion system secretin GspD [Ralstonia mannitolilytica]|uniref:Secretin GspD 2 n=1 Tax=Ralstonia mannitolilytica TaxID=105219 RepID=A0AAD2B2Q7_9RALS|nr:type II secretion system secretin GspD [Ralstonia mannitolilytica]ATG18617.1 type II secretion system protein GspD [Ralstonia pickettii]ANA33244.1 general secretion pathway protein GspD [Ralstonia mannitolilytica]MBY4720816.1 type II secretion system secretin GspD [Ralstonia mannitolilytica]CAJ0695477.1 Secretin GspD 2 [Ralstonia mannitolilytica]CAJ0697785.1 Secretin GspD 2 [Ralstonia mannitolilytica]